jgi:hypothetical protein
VIRGGFGVLFGGNYDGNVLQTGSQGFIRLGSANAGSTPLRFRLRDGVPDDLLEIPAERDLTGLFGTIGSPFPQSRIDWVDQNHRTPYAYDANFGIQHQVGAHLLEGRYLGKFGHSLNIRDLNINQIHPANLARTDLPRDQLRPFTQSRAPATSGSIRRISTIPTITRSLSRRKSVSLAVLPTLQRMRGRSSSTTRRS